MLTSTRYLKKLFSTKKNLFTISIIGRPNVGKSTLLNALAGEKVSLVDSLPGLTRDRKEIVTDFLDTKVKLVDTAGVNTLDDKETKKQLNIFNESNADKNQDKLSELSIFQTRNALIYSDLAIFVVDGRKGFTYEDYEIANWMDKYIEKEDLYIKDSEEEVDEEERKLLEDSDKQENKEDQEAKVVEEQTVESESNEKDESTFFKNIQDFKKTENIKIPDIILVANKVEDNFIPYELFESQIPSFMNYPILISAQKGDGMADLYSEIEKKIPFEYKNQRQDLEAKRVERYQQYKEKMKEDFIKYLESIKEKQDKQEKASRVNVKDSEEEDKESIDEKEENEFKYNLKTWEKDFDFFNGRDIEENSDYDSDNDIDPTENFVIKHKHTRIFPDQSSTGKMTTHSESNLTTYKKPIKVALVGQTNVGKSSIINSLLKENRVIVSDVPGTTRDAIPIEWLYKGKRIELIDTAGLVHNSNFKDSDRIEKIISQKTMNTIKHSQIVVFVFDSFKALTPFDLKIINFIGKEGRGLVLISNKWDLIPQGYKIKAKSWIANQIEKHCTEYKIPKIIFTSVKKNYKLDLVMEEVIKTYQNWNTRISTRLLNSFRIQLSKIARKPNIKGEYLNLKFMSQLKVRPPSFVLFLNDIDLFFKNHEMFVKRMIAKEFGLVNVPMRFVIRDREVRDYSTESLSDLKTEDFKLKNTTTAVLERKIKNQKRKIRDITYLRRSKGAELLNGRHKPRSIRE